ncbi:MAG: Na/Pi cotransporter family protein [Firmicutes bacterium]|nr:Na/Pi cotransporter family protein [Bacillota bacterium]
MHIFLLGLFLFLIGLEGSKKGVESISSAGFEGILHKLASNLPSSIFTGIIVTAILQSSSAVSIVLISLLESGLISVKSALAILLGANIGTTFTVQLISFPVLNTYPYLIILGLFLIILGCLTFNKIKMLGFILISFGVIFAGLNMMSAFFQREEVAVFIKYLLIKSGNNVLLNILLGMMITAVIQSSSAVTGITVSLAVANLITLPAAIAIALGSNIGTCITAYLASINCEREAKILANGHFIFNIIGVVLLLPVFDKFVYFINLTSTSLIRQIANAHTIFNIFNLFVFLPVFNSFVRFIGGEKG